MVWWDSSAGKQRSNQLANMRRDETSFPLFSKIFYQRISRQRQPKRKCLFSCIFVNNRVKGIKLKKICLSLSLSKQDLSINHTKRYRKWCPIFSFLRQCELDFGHSTHRKLQIIPRLNGTKAATGSIILHSFT